MSLSVTKLQKLRELGNGGYQAQCPACAEAGQDRKGEHLRISSEGKFGCCVFPGDREHRLRIFALAGDHGPKAIRVRVASAKTAAVVQLDLLGRLGRAFQGQKEECRGEKEDSGTVGTGFQYPRAYADEQVNNDLFIRKLTGCDQPVPSVPTVQPCQQLETGIPSVPAQPGPGIEVRPPAVRLPYLTEAGDLVIPFDSPERYHWWTGGQSVRQTREELMERKENDAAPF